MAHPHHRPSIYTPTIADLAPKTSYWVGATREELAQVIQSRRVQHQYARVIVWGEHHADKRTDT